MRNLFILLPALVLTSCATFSKSDCEQMDWRARGRETALEGEPLYTTANKFDRQCQAKHGVPTNRLELEAGFKAGAQEFCEPDRLRRWIADGHEYKGICTHLPADTVNASLAAGRASYLERQLSDKDDEISRLQSKINSLEGEVSSLRSQVDSVRASCMH